MRWLDSEQQPEISTPSNPGAGFDFIYPKSDHLWYVLDSTGTERRLSNGIATDTIFDNAGDLVIGSGADTAVKLAIGTGAGKALVADPNATNKASIQFPHGVEEAGRGTAPTTLGSTFDRGIAVETNSAALSTGRLTVVRILLPKGLSITTITFWSMTTALSVGVNQWFALFDLNKGKLAVTADDTSTAWAANSSKALAVAAGPFVTTYAGIHYLGIMVKATTVPSMAGAGGGNSNFRSGAGGNFTCASADSGLTNPASCPSTAGSLNTLAGAMLYAEVS